MRGLQGAPLTPELAATRLCAIAQDARAAVVLDASGALAGSSEQDAERAQQLARLTLELLQAVDAAAPARQPEQVEVQAERGAVYVVRRPDWTVAAVARRSALSSLMFYDIRSVLSELEANGT